MLGSLTTLLCFAVACLHLSVLVLQEKDSAEREREEAAYAHAAVCDNSELMNRLGRFHRCGEIHDVLAVGGNLWVLAADRAVGRFLQAVKQQTFEDATHVGLVAVLTLLGMSAAALVTGHALRAWGAYATMRKQIDAESPSLRLKGQTAINVS